MIKEEYVMKFSLGLHARPSAKIVEGLKPLNLDKARIITKEVDANLRSLLEILLVQVAPGKKFKIVLEGKDEKAAKEFLDNFFYNNKDEPYATDKQLAKYTDSGSVEE